MGCKSNNCVKILIYLVISIYYCGAQDTSENPVITIQRSLMETNLHYVEPNKSLQIIIKRTRARHVRCYDHGAGHRVTFIENEYPNYDMDSVINITRVTPAMSTMWCCDIHQKHLDTTNAKIIFMGPDDVGHQVCFSIAVKGALSVEVSINGEYLNFTRTGLNVKHVGETSFHFINGQNIELSCFNEPSNYQYFGEVFEVGIEYFNENGTKIFKGPQSSYFTAIRTKLTSQEDRFYMDCICYKKPVQEQRYRTYFYEKKMEYDPDVQKNGIRVSVNGLLQHYVRINDTYLEYLPFAYINGEVITVTCEVEREDSNDSLQLYFIEKQMNTFKVVRMDNKIIVIFNTSAIWNEETLICEKINAEKRYYARMKFESNFKHTGAATILDVFGLPRQNILYQYLINKNLTTVYKYSVNESINLGCVLNMKYSRICSIQWNFNSGESILNDSYIMGTNEDSMVLCAAENFTRKLTESDDNKVIMCSAYDIFKKRNVVNVKLQLKNTLKSENSLSVDVSINGEYLNFTRMGPNVKHDGETSFHFIDGQDIEFFCVHTDDRSLVRTEYFNRNGKKIFEVAVDDLFETIEIKLTTRREGSFIDCIVYDPYSPAREYRYRVYFYKKKMDYNPDVQKNLIRLSVNGLLQPYVRINDTYLQYAPFRYINGEVINVTCEAEREYSNSSLQIYFLEEQTNNFEVIRMDNKIVVILNTPAIPLYSKTLICENINKKKRYFARMSLESKIEESGRYHFGTVFAIGVFGLPRQNILLRYFGFWTWLTVYEYSVNESINLGCILKYDTLKNDTTFEWNFNSGESKSNCGYYTIDIYEDDDYKYAAKNFTRKLTESDDKKVIKCIAYYQSSELISAEVILQLKNTTNSENLYVETSYLGIYIGFPTFIIAVTLVAISWVCYKKNAPVPAPTPNANMPKPFYVNEMFRRNPNEGIYIRPESHYREEHPHGEVHHYEEVHHCKEAPNNSVQEDIETTTIPENVSTTQLDNAVPNRSRYSEPDDHHYSEINNSQCSQPTEGPQRLTKMYNEPYDHCV